MKTVAVLLLLSAILYCCNGRLTSWKEAQNKEYGKVPLLYDCSDFYLYRDSGTIVLTYELGEFYSPYIKTSIPGVIKVTGNKAWIDTSRFNLDSIKEYFSEFTNHRMR